MLLLNATQGILTAPIINLLKVRLMSEPESTKIEYDEYAFPWLSEEEWEAALQDLKRKVGSLLGVFNCYGMGDYLPHVLWQILDSAIDFSMRVRGEDRPIGKEHEPIPRPTD
jgi:hypothetical protein